MGEISLRNKNLDFDKTIDYVVNEGYIFVCKGEYEKLGFLREKVKLYLKTLDRSC